MEDSMARSARHREDESVDDLLDFLQVLLGVKDGVEGLLELRLEGFLLCFFLLDHEVGPVLIGIVELGQKKCQGDKEDKERGKTRYGVCAACRLGDVARERVDGQGGAVVGSGDLDTAEADDGEERGPMVHREEAREGGRVGRDGKREPLHQSPAAIVAFLAGPRATRRGLGGTTAGLSGMGALPRGCDCGAMKLSHLEQPVTRGHLALVLPVGLGVSLISKMVGHCLPVALKRRSCCAS